MASSTYTKAGLPETILGIRCQSHRARKIYELLSYHKVLIKKGTSKVKALHLLNTFSTSLSPADKDAISNWLSDPNSTIGQLAGLRGEVDHNNRKNESEQEIARLNNLKINYLDPNGIECPACAEILSPSGFPDRKITSTCQHEPTFCKICIEKSIGVSINHLSDNGVECPECIEPMAESDIRYFVSADKFASYTQRKFVEAMKNVPGFAQCASPSCHSGQFHDSKSPEMICDTCGFHSCVTHRLAWHEDWTCDEFDIVLREREENNALSEKYWDDYTKQCPCPTCGIHTVKEGNACDHVTCTVCRTQYCWVCLVTYDKVRDIGGTAHDRSCRLWKMENPAEYKARRAEERRESKRRKLERSE